MRGTKLLIYCSFLIIISGFTLLWFGLQSSPQVITPSPLSIPLETVSPIATYSAVKGIEGERVLVSKVVDGDTIQINTGQTVRFIGIDTPETVDPRRPVGCFGKEASNETKSLLSGKEIILQKDVSETDKYGRLLRLIFLPLENGQVLFVNDYLVRAGFAKASAYPPDDKYSEQFKGAEITARDQKKGLWSRCN